MFPDLANGLAVVGTAGEVPGLDGGGRGGMVRNEYMIVSCLHSQSIHKCELPEAPLSHFVLLNPLSIISI